jgi:hypothetical protein
MDSKELREKITLGLDLTFKKLVLSLRQSDDYLAFSKDGKIIKVKARDIQLDENQEFKVGEP